MHSTSHESIDSYAKRSRRSSYVRSRRRFPALCKLALALRERAGARAAAFLVTVAAVVAAGVGTTHAAERPSAPPPNSGSGDGAGYVRLIRPLPGWHAAIAWMEAIQDTRRDEPGWIEIDWLRLHAVVDGQDRILREDNFGPGHAICGGLYMRDPWYGDGSPEGNVEEPMQQSATDDAVRLTVSDRPDKVWHWYNCERAEVPQAATHVWATARIRVHGSAAVGLGIDYWRQLDSDWAGFDVNNTEACATQWFYDDEPGWRVITVAKPETASGR